MGRFDVGRVIIFNTTLAWVHRRPSGLSGVSGAPTPTTAGAVALPGPAAGAGAGAGAAGADAGATPAGGCGTRLNASAISSLVNPLR